MAKTGTPSQSIFNTESEDSPDLYKTLELSSREATEAEIRTAYRKQALRYHPDKISSSKSESEKLEARQKFDQVGLAYKILSDPKLRERYDRTGKTDENFLDGLDDQASWSAYFKDLWSGEVNAQTIEEFTKKYRGSEEELDELREHYLKFDGSLPDILSHTMCASDDCEPRLVKRIDQMIKDGVLQPKPTWEKTKKDTKARAKRRQMAEQESKEAEQLAKELGVHDQLFGNQNPNGSSKRGLQNTNQEDRSDPEGSLAALFRANAANASKKHEAFIARLEAKALAESSTKKPKNKSAKGIGKKRRHLVDDESDPDHTNHQQEQEQDQDQDLVTSTSGPTEEEFQKIQANLNSHKKAKKDSKTDVVRSSSSRVKKNSKK